MPASCSRSRSDSCTLSCVLMPGPVSSCRASYHIYFALKLSIVITFDEINRILERTCGGRGRPPA
jgi:hypothetical protein